MKRSINKIIFQIVFLGIIAIFLSNCEKDDENTIQKLNNSSSANFNPGLIYGTMTDQEGNQYKTITIGDQTWMAENLRTTRYRNGNNIAQVKDKDSWRNLTSGAYCNYNNTNSYDTIATFGRLYNYYAVTDDRKIAPEGWQVPTDEDWNILITYLGDGNMVLGDSISGAHLKEEGDSHWIVYTSENPAVDNSSGFTAIPAGWRAITGFGQTTTALFWIFPEYENSISIRQLLRGTPRVLKLEYSFIGNLGLSIRCIKRDDK